MPRPHYLGRYFQRGDRTTVGIQAADTPQAGQDGARLLRGSSLGAMIWIALATFVVVILVLAH